MTEKKTVFDTLNGLNVSDLVEKKPSGKDKNGNEKYLTYLSWCCAWGEIKKRYPEAQYEVKMFDGKPYIFDENLGYMVFTEMTIEDITHSMYLPVMNSTNKAMKNKPYTIKTRYGEQTVEAATMFDINTAIMRCLTKNMAMFGLGLYIYKGEDIPDTEQEATVEKDPTEEARKRPVDGTKIKTLVEIAVRKGFSESVLLAQYKKTHPKATSLEGMIYEDWEHLYKGYEKLPDRVSENEQVDLGL